MAQGFIQPDEEKTMEKIRKACLYELLSRSWRSATTSREQWALYIGETLSLWNVRIDRVVQQSRRLWIVPTPFFSPRCWVSQAEGTGLSSISAKNTLLRNRRRFWCILSGGRRKLEQGLLQRLKTQRMDPMAEPCPGKSMWKLKTKRW